MLPCREDAAQGRGVEGGLRRVGRVEPVTDRIASRAARLRAERQIELRDALILATAVELRASEMLTFDRRWRSLDPRVRILGG